jgi:translocation and assembly module TamB
MADAKDMESTDHGREPWGRGWTLFALIVFVLVLLFLIAWTQRNGLAGKLVQDQLQKYGVRASYSIDDVGFRTQRLSNIVIGDPAHPDLVVKTAEIDVSFGFSGAVIRHIRAQDVQLNARFADGKFQLGELDKFRDLKSTKPFEIPDYYVDLKQARLRLDTPWGELGAGVDGRGWLREKFSGALAVRAPAITREDCSAIDARFDGRVLIENRKPGLNGPMRVETMACKSSGLLAKQARLEGELRLSETFDHWFGDMQFGAGSLQAKTVAFNRPQGTLEFDGSAARTNFGVKLERAVFAAIPLRVRNLIADGTGYLDFSDNGVQVASRGEARLQGGAIDAASLLAIEAINRQAQDSPVGPLLANLSPKIRTAASNFDGGLRYDAHIATSGPSNILIDVVELTARSGARIEQSGLIDMRKNGSDWIIRSPLQLALSGGGFPQLKLALNQGAAGLWSGNLVLTQYAVPGASLSLPKLAFSGSPGGAWRFDGQALVSGPLPGGYVKGLILPIDARWDGRNLALFQNCQTLRFDSIKYDSIVAAKQGFRLCPNNGGSVLQAGGLGTKFNTSIPDFAFDGFYAGSRLKAHSRSIRFDLAQGFTANGMDIVWGDAPIRASSPTVRFSFAKGFTASDVKVEAGKTDAITHFDIDKIDGRLNPKGLSGSLSGVAGQIANVPLLIDSASGTWTYRNGAIGLEGALGISDAAQVDRFLPLKVPSVLVDYVKGTITATGGMFEPTTGIKVAEADIRHSIQSGVGRALLAVEELRFGDRLQPSMLTPLTVGVIANVLGLVTGDGRIDWDPSGVRSSGRFSTADTDLAAALGPVEGMSGEIIFTDLLGLQTGPGQILRLASVNPGIAALNGQIKYQLLTDNRVQIESGSWPFAGGQLQLDPTILDFDIEKPRRLTFHVVGVDAEKFLAQYEFENLTVSGVFDGTLPMVFDATGGRIIGGSLVARAGGGELSYLGQLSYKDMGVFANYAFQALKSIRYNELAVDVDGDLGGEIITKVRFSGIQQGSLAKRNFITKQLARIPIKFNISITAEFLKLIGSIRSIYDPTYDNHALLPDLIARQAGTAPVAGEAEQNPKPTESKP